jgi:hypothetical protein
LHACAFDALTDDELLTALRERFEALGLSLRRSAAEASAAA